MLSALYARPSVRLSVRHTGGSVKTVKVRIMKFSPYSSPIPLVLAGKFYSEILSGSPSGGVKQGRGGEKKPFSSFKRRYLENGK